eukprot:TRINITY_DN8715_c0_g1_i1.p1 TRINITY_DN8715_c0_g1~~TRINITY_DN8715_c0_g1_i1.p1  ORF type:complete len:154 (-),score=47.83 TRINITY_DN8715_c0_g1_i1:37-498(-)
MMRYLIRIDAKSNRQLLKKKQYKNSVVAVEQEISRIESYGRSKFHVPLPVKQEAVTPPQQKAKKYFGKKAEDLTWKERRDVLLAPATLPNLQERIEQLRRFNMDWMQIEYQLGIEYIGKVKKPVQNIALRKEIISREIVAAIEREEQTQTIVN